MKSATLTTVLQVDAVANVTGGVALLATGAWLADPVGLASPWPLWLVGVVLVVNGIENWLVARRPSRTGLQALLAVDVLFGTGAVLFALADPTGAATWARWAVVVVGDAALVVGLVKLVGLRATAGDVPTAQHAS